MAEIEGYQKLIDGARAVVDIYRPQITVDPEWQIELLWEIPVQWSKVVSMLPKDGEVQ